MERSSGCNQKPGTEMNKPKLLFVEDEESDLTAFLESVDVYGATHGRVINIITCQNLPEALDTLDDSFDGAIIDLTLNGQQDGGAQVINRIFESQYRVPIAIFTGTPIDHRDNSNIRIFIKGEAEHDEIIEWFCGYYDTGLTRIMGGRGKFEEILFQVFTHNLVPQIDEWIPYGKADPGRTEMALLRHTFNHLSYLLEDDSENCYPEEFYLSLPSTERESVRTGRIVNTNNEIDSYVVMTPACDLVRRNGGFKTDRILVAFVEPVSKMFPWYNRECHDDEQKNKLEVAFRNNHTLYHHWLPNAGCFEGGFLNFRKLSAFRPREFRRQFEVSQIQISPTFVKDIVSRFSSYYARQGQPGIELDGLINRGEVSADENCQ